MKYQFGFSGARLIVALMLIVVLGFVTFLAGVVVGVRLWAPTQTEIALLKANRPSPVGAPVAGPKAPELAVAAPAAPAMPAVAVPQLPPAPAPAAPATPSVPASTQPAMPLAALAPPETRSQQESDLFSVQVGSFRDSKLARQLQSELRERGYTAIAVNSAMDSDKREWHVVRLTGFSTLESASRVAAGFTAKEHIQALVRRSDEL